MKTKSILNIVLASIIVFFTSCVNTQNDKDTVASNSNNSKPIVNPTNKVLLASQVKWEHLNPARGDKSPQAGTLWGNRNGTEATGFLVKFTDGFSSPPHIHNVSYRGLVINGLVHNDDPEAKHMWMPAGSFWTQPVGEEHITAAKGNNNMAYLEIEKGPYLVLPSEKAFDSGERPVNIDASNLVWLDASNTNYIKQTNKPNPSKITFIWGTPKNNELYGSLIKLSKGFKGKINSFGSSFKSVVIQGQLEYQIPNESAISKLEIGSYFSSEGESTHHISSNLEEETIIYVRTDGKYEIISEN